MQNYLPSPPARLQLGTRGQAEREFQAPAPRVAPVRRGAHRPRIGKAHHPGRILQHHGEAVPGRAPPHGLVPDAHRRRGRPPRDEDLDRPGSHRPQAPDRAPLRVPGPARPDKPDQRDPQPELPAARRVLHPDREVRRASPSPSDAAMKEPEIELAGIGNPIVDLVAQVPDSFLSGVPGEKGGMVLVDDAEMGRILALRGPPPPSSTGGSAANATFNAARLGLRTTFIGKVGNDRLADMFVDRFSAAGVDVSRFKRGSVANARCLALVTPDAQRTMRTSLGAAMTLSPAEITPADFRGVRHAHVEGYLVFNHAL